MVLPRLAHTASLLFKGEVLIMGGSNVTTDYASAEIFDTTGGGAGQFRELGHMMNFERIYTGSMLISVGKGLGQVLIPGGCCNGPNSWNNADFFVPGNVPFDGGFDLTLNSMSVGRTSSTITELLDGSELVVMVTGPNAGKFVTTGNMLDALVDHAAAILRDGQVLITGGWAKTSPNSAVATNHSELYHP